MCAVDWMNFYLTGEFHTGYVINYGLRTARVCVCVCVCVCVGTAPFHSRKHNCLQTSTVLINGGWDTYRALLYVFRVVCLFVFLPRHWPTNRLCLAFTSQRSTGVTTAVASARPSPPVHASQTAVGMRRRSGCVLGKSSYSFILCTRIVLMCGSFYVNRNWINAAGC